MKRNYIIPEGYELTSEQLQNAYCHVPTNPVVIDFTGCKYLGEVHLVLKESFGLPDYYGENWDALWDVLDGLFKDTDIEVYGLQSLPKEFGEEIAIMLKVFQRIEAKGRGVHFKYME